MDDKNFLKNIDEKLSALIALQAYSMDTSADERPRVETILHGAGLSPSNIARILGKKADTVIKAINRSKK